MNTKLIFFFILGIDVSILFFQIDNLSISFAEAQILYEEKSLLSSFFNYLFSLFGINDYTLRLPIIGIHLGSALLFYEISKNYLKNERDRLWLLLLFVMLPGVLSAAIILSHAFFILFGLMLYVYLDQRLPTKYTNILLLLYSFLDGGFLYLFLGVLIYTIFVKEYKNVLFLLIVLAISTYMFSLEIHGIPSGHFLDSIGVYSAIFTPIVFLYIVYALYRRYLLDKVDKLWYIATTALIFSLLLSFRQRLAMEFFAPYLILALPLAAQTFAHSYRVRLKMFRKRYKAIFMFSFLFLLLHTSLIVFNTALYSFVENPKKHFAYDMHIAKELSLELKKLGINCIQADYKMQQRLNFYGIRNCQTFSLNEISLDDKRASFVTISYSNRAVYKASVTKVNKN